MAKASLTPEELEQLRWAYRHLEHPSFAARLSNVIGTPIEQTLKLLPKSWHQRVNKAAEFSIRQAMHTAARTLDTHAISGAHDNYHKFAAFAVGAVGGFFGPIALVAELPVITLLMLRSIADIARSEGENLGMLDARLACVEVFALGGRSNDDDAADTGYYGLRSTLAFHFAGIADYGGASSLSVPAGVGLIRGIAARFGVVISDEIAMQMVPVAGAVSGALINLVFMQHFQDVARGHFTLRRLERKYNPDLVRKEYERTQKGEIKLIRGFSPLEGW
ncbi:EcsC family protein [Methylocaldum sp.]|uniref:EcsC family protein n=1 Tax=Methylocaldum sp. TaxID=1969727 RepID=UPI002D3B6CF6|nr:EcsC family protein [Methylocaldum sp.]HYE36560.1 EcsC family protein [Methylocaldum sp.]